MIEDKPTKITILGAGLVGTLLSIYLAKRNFEVHVFERRPDFRQANVDVGRSINLAVSDRGWKALEVLGIDQEIRKIAIPMYGRMIHHQDGTVKHQPYGKENQAIYSLSRRYFNETLVNIADTHENVHFHFNEKCWDVNMTDAITHSENTITGERLNVKADVIFGADGAFSSVRNAMLKTERYNYSQTYLEHGYKELTIPAGENGQHQLSPNALHIWPRGKFMLIALPNADGTFTCTLFLPFKGDASFDKLHNAAALNQFFLKTFADVVPLMPNLNKEFFKNPTSSLVSISCYPWCYENKVALIGDAAHSMVPFYGQGMNAGFEDVRELDAIIDKHGNDWFAILEEYQQMRKLNTDAISELARQNFVEMRDFVANESFLLRKKIEAFLHEKYPKRWTPLYSMVTFSQIPYADAMEEGNRQNEIMDRIMTIVDIENIWQSVDYESYLSTMHEVQRAL